MAQETLNVAVVSEVNAVWTDSENIGGQYDVATASFEQDNAGDYSGTVAMENSTETPTDINHFKIIYWCSRVNYGDVFTLQFYDLDSTSWINFNSSPLEESETEYIDGQNLVDILVKFDAAADKQAWINAFGVRWDIQIIKAYDEIIIATQGVEMEIEYTASAFNPITGNNTQGGMIG